MTLKVPTTHLLGMLHRAQTQKGGPEIVSPSPLFSRTCRLGAGWSIEQHGVVGRQLFHMASGTVTEGGSRGTAPSKRRGLGENPETAGLQIGLVVRFPR